jgi:hypothetical protein
MREVTRFSTVRKNGRSLTLYLDPDTEDSYYVVEDEGLVIYTGSSSKEAKDIFEHGTEPRSI